MLSREQQVSLGFAVVAVVLGLGLDLLTAQPDWLVIVIVAVVGLVLPRLFLKLSEK